MVVPLILNATAIKGALKKPRKKVSLDDMQRAITLRAARLCKG